MNELRRREESIPRPTGAGDLWRVLQEDARFVLVILASEHGSLAADEIVDRVLDTYHALPQVARFRPRLHAHVVELLEQHERTTRARS